MDHTQTHFNFHLYLKTNIKITVKNKKIIFTDNEKEKI